MAPVEAAPPAGLGDVPVDRLGGLVN